jgi:hypothetical protein
MKKIAVVVIALQISVLAAIAADVLQDCTLCVGAVSDLKSIPASPLPLLLQLRQDDLAVAGSWIDTLTPEQRRKLTVVVTYAVSHDADPLLDVEQHTKTIVEWARLHGPLDAIGIVAENADSATAGYAIKRLSVTAQGQSAASRIVLPLTSLEALAKLYETGAQTYFDVALTDAAGVADLSKWLMEKDPAKKIFAIVTPQSPNALFDLMQPLARGASRSFLGGPLDVETLSSLASVNRALRGDYAFDATGRTTVLDATGNAVEMPVLAFVRGEDLRTLLVPRGNASAATIVSLSGDQYQKPRRIDAAGERDITDVGRKGGRFLIGAMPSTHPFALSVEHAEKPDANVTKEAISVATRRGITVEEIIRNHQTYKAYQESIQPRFVARNATKLRFTLAGAEAIEATIAGDYFSEPGRADWVWQDFYINGVKWKYGRIPELPLIQPEKVTQLPLDIHLTNEYRYELVRETDIGGYHTYEVRFDPPPNAPAALPLYRGTVWIDSRSWTRVRISMVQLNLAGEVLSNEERVDFQPFARDTHAPLTAAEVAKTDPREIVWLPLTVSAQQVISAAGRGTVILRSTELSNFRINPPDFDSLHAQASASDSRMVRESTESGMKYLEKRGNGERVVKEGFDTARMFMVGGIHHDSGLQYPVVPLGGIDYFNFNLANRGIQTNVFFAGVVVTANATNPDVAHTRTNVGADFFAIAIPTDNSIYRQGREVKAEAVRTLRTSLNLRAGHPFLEFGKIDVSLGIDHFFYRRATDTAPDFIIPTSTFEIGPQVDAQYARWGSTLTAFYGYTKRTAWRPWGNLAEYNDNQKTYTQYGASFAKSFYLPKFQRISVDVDYLDGQRLDRFSQYQLGFFGGRQIHGVRSGSVRGDRMILAHLSYGLVFSDQFRLEALYDHGLIDNRFEGLHHQPYQGVGIAGQTVGPWGTLLRLDLGKTVGKNSQSGFVANVVFLKLF